METILTKFGITNRIYNSQIGWWTKDNQLVKGGVSDLTREDLIFFIIRLLYI